VCQRAAIAGRPVHQGLRKSSGGLAMLAAIHRTPSRTSIATERHKVKALTKGLPLM